MAFKEEGIIRLGIVSMMILLSVSLVSADATITITVTVVSDNLTVVLNSPENNGYLANSTPSFNFTAFTDYEGYISCELVINGTGRGRNDTVLKDITATITANSSLSDGSYNFYINCTFDGVSRTSENRTFTVDTIPPTMGSTSIIGQNMGYLSVNGSGYYDSVNIYATALEDVSWLIGIYNSAGGMVNSVSINNFMSTGNQVWNGSTSSGTNAPNGNYTVNITITDRAGNSNMTFIGNVSINAVPPAIFSVNITPLNPGTDNDLNCSVTVRNPYQSLNADFTWFRNSLPVHDYDAHVSCGANYLNHLVIYEVLYHGTSSNDEYVVLYNPTNSTVVINSSWKIGDNKGNDTLCVGSIIPGGYYLIVDKNSIYTGFADCNLTAIGNGLNDKDDSVRLYHNGIRIDAVGWGNTSVEGSPAPVVNENQTIKRISYLDMENNSADFTAGAKNPKGRSNKPEYNERTCPTAVLVNNTNTTRGENWTCIVSVYDRWGNSISNSTSVIQNSIPSTPVLISPVNGTATNTMPELVWNSSRDFDNDLISYLLNISGSLITTNSTTYTPTSGTGQYFWSVQANDSLDSSTWSEVWTFTITTTTVPQTPETTTTTTTTSTTTTTIPAKPITINEVMYNPVQNDNYNEWIEVYNPSGNSIDITTGWTLCNDRILAGYIDRNGNIYNYINSTIPANGYAVITDGNSGTDVYSNFNVSSSAIALHVDANSLCGGLTNTGGTIILKNSSRIVDSVTYSNSWGANGNGNSLERTESGNWAESLNIGGTPGYQNSVYSQSTTTTTTTTTSTTSTITTTSTTTTTTPSLECTDSDGKDYYVKGTIYAFGGNYIRDDFCISDTELREYWCEDGNTAMSVDYLCPGGCSDGICITATTTTTTTTSTTTTVPRVLPEMVKNIITNISKKKPMTLDIPEMDLEIEVETKETVNVNMTVEKYTENPVNGNLSGYSIAYISIRVNDELRDALKSAVITFYYKDDEIPLKLNKNSVSFYYFNQSGGWERIDKTKINKKKRYVQAKLTHFSYYAISGVIDEIPPKIIGVLPNGDVDGNDVLIQAITDEDAVCRFDTRNRNYENMTNEFTQTGETVHRERLNLSEGHYRYYVRCMDFAENVNNPVGIRFTVIIQNVTAGGDFNLPAYEAVIISKCTDGIQNYGETGIDCGGPCNPCQTTTTITTITTTTTQKTTTTIAATTTMTLTTTTTLPKPPTIIGQVIVVSAKGGWIVFVGTILMVVGYAIFRKRGKESIEGIEDSALVPMIPDCDKFPIQAFDVGVAEIQSMRVLNNPYYTGEPDILQIMKDEEMMAKTGPKKPGTRTARGLHRPRATRPRLRGVPRLARDQRNLGQSS